MPSRTGTKGRGKLQIDRVLPGVGRFKLSSGVTNKRDFHRRNDMITRLSEEGKADVLMALKERKLSIDAVYAACQGTGTTSMAALTATANLWTTIDELLPSLGTSPETRKRYELSLSKLEDCGILPVTATVADLTKVKWDEVRPHFRGAADWNHLRRALGTFLTQHLGSVTHQLRGEIMGRIKGEKEASEPTTVTLDDFWSAVELLPEWARFPVICLALSGARMGEYIHSEAAHLDRKRLEWKVNGKTGWRIISVPDAALHVFEAAVPARYAPKPAPGQRNSSTKRYQRLAKAWMTAARELGLSCTLHDLRHLSAQLARAMGADETAIQHHLGHSSLAMTLRYLKRQGQVVGAGAAAKGLQLDKRASKLMRIDADAVTPAE